MRHFYFQRVFLKNDLSEVSLEHNLIKKICDDNFHGGTILQRSFTAFKLHFTKINLPRLEITTKGTEKSSLEISQKGLR